jgi:hypothetical protein
MVIDPVEELQGAVARIGHPPSSPPGNRPDRGTFAVEGSRIEGEFPVRTMRVPSR